MKMARPRQMNLIIFGVTKAAGAHRSSFQVRDSGKTLKELPVYTQYSGPKSGCETF